MSIEAMRQALEALEAHADIGIKSDKAITTLRTAIEQAEKQEPVAWADECRIELVTAIHTFASDYENALGVFRDDTEARRKAEGDIAHARKIAAKWNWNGTAPQPAAKSEQEPSRAEKMREAGYTRRPTLREFPSGEKNT